MTYFEGFLAFWRAGEGDPPTVTTDDDLAAFVNLANSNFKIGIRLAFVSYYSLSDTYTGLWVSGSGAEHVQGEMDHDTFLAADHDQFYAGRRLISLDRDGDQYVAVWREGFGSGAQHIEPSISAEDLVNVDKDQRGAGRRMTILLQADDDEYSAVWRAGSGLQWVAAGETPDDLIALDAGYRSKGFRMVSLYAYEGHWSAVWRPGKGLQPIHNGVTPDELETYKQQYAAQGLHLHALRKKRYHTA
jgi:hypothetical protein